MTSAQWQDEVCALSNCMTADRLRQKPDSLCHKRKGRIRDSNVVEGWEYIKETTRAFVTPVAARRRHTKKEPFINSHFNCVTTAVGLMMTKPEKFVYLLLSSPLHWHITIWTRRSARAQHNLICRPTATRCGPEIESQWLRDFPQSFRPALGPTQPHVLWVPSHSWG